MQYYYTRYDCISSVLLCLKRENVNSRFSNSFQKLVSNFGDMKRENSFFEMPTDRF